MTKLSELLLEPLQLLFTPKDCEASGVSTPDRQSH